MQCFEFPISGFRSEDNSLAKITQFAHFFAWEHLCRRLW